MRLSSWLFLFTLIGAGIYVLPQTDIPRYSADVFYNTTLHVLQIFFKLS